MCETHIQPKIKNKILLILTRCIRHLHERKAKTLQFTTTISAMKIIEINLRKHLTKNKI